MIRVRSVKHKLCLTDLTLITFCMFNILFFPENRAVYEIMWKNIVERGRPLMAIWRMRIACWITKATNTPSEYVIFIVFPLQQWLHERTSMLRYMHITCIVITEKACLLRGTS